ncbi:hypothetical protein BCU68_09660 [Vibrio sp. 10N.286.49.B3]|uniref:AsmA family protein n=1 Tax=Vibrio sp. 10N.286.49.B3 TaxID=1880855 RepID=UPI000C828B8E|nr:AsmA family protein [Vibrio sp. 10N.286.49.B3]PMH46042.1 hypothetical protein BCU68_09660 [Vibrio sp. 10N.286.49.B3]
MKKVLWFFIALVALSLLSLASLLIVLQTSLATPLSNTLLARYFDPDIQVERIDYQFPNHLVLHRIDTQDPAIPSIDKVEIWLKSSNMFAMLTGKPFAIESLLIDGLSLQQGVPKNLVTPTLFGRSIGLHQLAIQNLDYADEQFSARGVSLQIRAPHWPQGHSYDSDDPSTPSPILPYGNLQLSADQLYWQAEAIDNVLMDMDYRVDDSTVYGLSFNWQGSRISTQAEQFGEAWSVINATFNKLTITPTKQALWRERGLLEKLPFVINHINSLDIIDSNFDDGKLAFNDIDATLENIHLLPFNPWQQEQASISFSAESIRENDTMFISPSAQLSLTPNQIEVTQLSTELYQGRLLLDALFTPTSAHFDNITLENMKWVAEKSDPTVIPPLYVHWLDLSLLSDTWFSQLEALTMDTLTVNNSQFIQLARTPYWQSSGTYARGKEVELIRDGRWGLWAGDLEISANNASYDQVISMQPIIDMTSRDGLWQLKRLFVPLEQGYINAQAEINFSQLSQPWSLSAQGDGMPLTPLLKTFNQSRREQDRPPVPFDIEGVSEFTLQASGLMGDEAMFNHGLSGQFSAWLRDVYLTPHRDEANLDQARSSDQATESDAILEKPAPIAATIADIHLTVDRGRARLPLVSIKAKEHQRAQLAGTLQGEWDLVSSSSSEQTANQNKPSLPLELHWQDQHFNADLLAD